MNLANIPDAIDCVVSDLDKIENRPQAEALILGYKLGRGPRTTMMPEIIAAIKRLRCRMDLPIDFDISDDGD